MVFAERRKPQKPRLRNFISLSVLAWPRGKTQTKFLDTLMYIFSYIAALYPLLK